MAPLSEQLEGNWDAPSFAPNWRRQLGAMEKATGTHLVSLPTAVLARISLTD